ncbi:metal ABC transporter permease [Paenibacillus doosanensis]|uniref:High-affinity zinc uptake system membrane protein ZnuB n=1 Tax=Paenibacillus konkukensis TaxID=2020716 RepID=A0ABY4RX52_9BACL|nr:MULTISPECIES: metal ABC transporter permease [Paenibacillus]MCS7458546.1 metal ABC transporter permease [Paenibacillus doosanensis]UQZ86931.1 High-affinity zinc uptake system membrane protein ZnuB [Paenibacillus konkukensis]
MDIFTEYFFQRALLGGLLIGLAAPMMGVFLVLRRLSMIGDTLAHVSIAGIALGFLLNVYPIGVGLLFAVLASFAIEWLRKAYKTYAELSIAIIMSGGVALATLLFTLGKGFNINVMSYFFGSIYTLDTGDLWVVLAVTVIVVGVILVNYKELFLMFFDEDAAGVSGLPLKFYNMMITILTALVITVAIKIVGALLVSSLLTIPVACSLLVARSFRNSLFWAVLFSEIAVVGGLVAAGVWSLAPGATIVLFLIGLLIISMFVKRGLRL